MKLPSILAILAVGGIACGIRVYAHATFREELVTPAPVPTYRRYGLAGMTDETELRGLVQALRATPGVTRVGSALRPEGDAVVSIHGEADFGTLDAAAARLGYRLGPVRRYEPPAEGSPAPDFTLPRLDGNGSITLSDFRGKKPVVLIFGSYT